MSPLSPPAGAMNRREAISAAAALLLALRGGRDAGASALNPVPLMSIACFIRYQIDPFQRAGFQQYAEAWGRIIPRCGGHLIGYFLPDEGTNDIAWGLIAFESLAAYEAYRARLRGDAEGRANFEMAQSKRLILREERTFVQVVNGTFEIPSRMASGA